jgi:hypothetical protein
MASSDATILNAASSQQSCRDPTTLTIPRRPNAQFSGSSSELDLLEGEAFLRWKHSMALLSEVIIYT